MNSYTILILGLIKINNIQKNTSIDYKYTQRWKLCSVKNIVIF